MTLVFWLYIFKVPIRDYTKFRLRTLVLGITDPTTLELPTSNHPKRSLLFSGSAMVETATQLLLRGYELEDGATTATPEVEVQPIHRGGEWFTRAAKFTK